MRAAMLSLMAMILLGPAALAVEQAPEEPQDLEPLPQPRVQPRTRFFGVYRYGLRCGMRQDQPARVRRNPYAPAGSPNAMVVEQVRYVLSTRDQVGLPIDHTMLQIVYRDVRTGIPMGFVSVSRHTLSEEARLPEGVTYPEREEKTEGIIGVEQGRLVARITVSRTGEEPNEMVLPMEAGERIEPDAAFIHQAYDRAEEVVDGQRVARFRFMDMVSLRRVEATVRRLPVRDIRLLGGKRVEVVPYDVDLVPINSKGEPANQPPVGQRLYFGKSDGQLVRSERDSDDGRWRLEESPIEVEPRMLERRPMVINPLQVKGLRFPFDKFQDYELVVADQTMARIGLFFVKTEDERGRTRYRSWSTVAMRTRDGGGRDEQRLTTYDKNFLPLHYECRGMARSVEVPSEDGKAEDGEKDAPEDEKRTEETQLKTGKYARVVKRDGRVLDIRREAGEDQKEDRLLADGPVFIMDINLLELWVLLAGAIELKPGHHTAVPVLHAKKTTLGTLFFKVQEPREHEGHKIYPIGIRGDTVNFLGRMLVDENGRLLSLLRTYPHGQGVEFRLAKPLVSPDASLSADKPEAAPKAP